MSRINELFHQKLSVINVGVERFQQDLAALQTEAVQLDWRPPAGGDPVLAAALDKLENNAAIDADGSRGTDACNFSIFYRAQQSFLRAHRQGTEFVEE